MGLFDFIGDLFGGGTEQEQQQQQTMQWGLAPWSQGQQEAQNWASQWMRNYLYGSGSGNLPVGQVAPVGMPNLSQQLISGQFTQPVYQGLNAMQQGLGALESAGGPIPGTQQNLYEQLSPLSTMRDVGFQQYAAPWESPVAQGMYKTYADTMNRQFQQQTVPSITSTGAKYGLTGSSPIAQQMGQATEGLNLNLGKALTDILSQQQSMGQGTMLQAPQVASQVGGNIGGLSNILGQLGTGMGTLGLGMGSTGAQLTGQASAANQMALTPLMLMLSLMGQGPGAVQTSGTAVGTAQQQDPQKGLIGQWLSPGTWF